MKAAKWVERRKMKGERAKEKKLDHYSLTLTLAAVNKIQFKLFSTERPTGCLLGFSLSPSLT